MKAKDKIWKVLSESAEVEDCIVYCFPVSRKPVNTEKVNFSTHMIESATSIIKIEGERCVRGLKVNVIKNKYGER